MQHGHSRSSAFGRCIQRGSRSLYAHGPFVNASVFTGGGEWCSNASLRMLLRKRAHAVARRQCVPEDAHLGVSVSEPEGRCGNAVRRQESEEGPGTVFRVCCLGGDVRSSLRPLSPVSCAVASAAVCGHTRMQCNNKKATAAVMRCGCWRGVFFEGCELHCGEVISTLVCPSGSLLPSVLSLLDATGRAGV